MNIDYIIGDDIVYIGNGKNGIKEGETFVAKELLTGCIHYPYLVDVGFRNSFGTKCEFCNKIINISNIHYADGAKFKKLDTLVNISELTEILEQPAFN